MKKIIVFLLIAALCVPGLFSCQAPDGTSTIPSTIPTVNNQELTPVQSVAAMYRVSQPTKVVAHTEQVIVEEVLSLECHYEIVTGYVDNTAASVYKADIQEIRSIEEGGQNEEVKELIKSYSRVVESIEGIGSRTNGGDWDAEGTVWTIGRGRMSIKLDDANVKNVKYENHVLTCVIPLAKVAKVLGETYAQDIDSDVALTIVDDGAVVTSIQLSYYLKANEEANLDRTVMYVKVDYTYDIEKITIE